VTYILKLLAELKNVSTQDKEKKQKEIIDLLSGEVNLRSKKELIEKFILENLPKIDDAELIANEFEGFMKDEQMKALRVIVEEENLSMTKTQELIEHYLFAEREPLRKEVLALIEGEQPSVLQRKKIGDRLLSKIISFVSTFIDGVSR